MNICIIIQARTTSTRFKEKIFHKFSGISVLEMVIKQSLLTKANNVILAVPKEQKKEFKELKKEYDIKIFGGDEENVLDRYYKCAKENKANIIVRITGDCPTIDHKIIDNSINFFLKEEYDYITNTSLDTSYKNKKNDEIKYKTNTFLCSGFDVEVFSFDALKKAYENVKTKSEKEHITIWMKENLNCGVVKELALIVNGKFSLDKKEDLKIIKRFLSLKEKGFIKIGKNNSLDS